jgi:hypothetical protein
MLFWVGRLSGSAELEIVLTSVRELRLANCEMRRFIQVAQRHCVIGGRLLHPDSSMSQYAYRRGGFGGWLSQCPAFTVGKGKTGLGLARAGWRVSAGGLDRASVASRSSQSPPTTAGGVARPLLAETFLGQNARRLTSLFKPRQHDRPI